MSDQKVKTKLTKAEELILLIIAIVFSYWSYHNIIDGSANGRYETYYFDDSPIMFFVVLFPKLLLATLSIYHIVKSRFFVE